MIEQWFLVCYSGYPVLDNLNSRKFLQVRQLWIAVTGIFNPPADLITWRLRPKLLAFLSTLPDFWYVLELAETLHAIFAFVSDYPTIWLLYSNVIYAGEQEINYSAFSIYINRFWCLKLQHKKKCCNSLHEVSANKKQREFLLWSLYSRTVLDKFYETLVLWLIVVSIFIILLLVILNFI